MSDSDLLDALAGEYVLGTLEGDERRSFETRLTTDRAARRAVDVWERRLTALVGPVEPVEPADPAAAPAGLLDRILASIDAAPAPLLTVRAGEGGWQAFCPGVSLKMLSLDAAAGMRSFLLRLDPGAEVPAHAHDADEECLVLSGDFEIDGLFLAPGDYHRASKGVQHGAARSRQGAVVFVRAHAA
ncbi:MAG: hypothetical protein FJX67_10600 [Alphaproteobacteria bacterium]|nr:hypothetical protein [Alphaproteobacteria bacterium]